MVKIGFVIRVSGLLRSLCGPKSRAVLHASKFGSPIPFTTNKGLLRRRGGTPKGRGIRKEQIRSKLSPWAYATMPLWLRT